MMTVNRRFVYDLYFGDETEMETMEDKLEEFKEEFGDKLTVIPNMFNLSIQVLVFTEGIVPFLKKLFKENE